MEAFRKAVMHLARLPGVGDRTAARFAYYLLQQPPEIAEELAAAIRELRRTLHECPRCCDLTDQPVCRRCGDPRRDPAVVCVVERPQDVQVIDNAGIFKGTYHVLHGALSPLAGVGPQDLRIDALIERLGAIKEVVLAMDPDVDGDATALYLARVLKPRGVRVTRLAHGISVGTEIEYADRVSLVRALENRREM